MEEKITALKKTLAEIDDLSRAAGVLSWDQQTNMPAGAAKARGHQLATINRIAHEMFIDEKVGKLLEELTPYAAELDQDSDDARLIRVTQRGYDKFIKVPTEMVAEQAQLRIMGNQAWEEAREKADFSLFQPHLEKIVDWSQRFSALFAPYEHIYDPLLDLYEPNMKTSEVQAIFDDLRSKQSELIREIAEKPQVEDAFLHQHFDRQKQWDFGTEAVTSLGYDWQRGFQGEVTHPFMTNLGYGDQRINNRVDENFFNPYFFGALHETGHAMYEQGIPEVLSRSPLYDGASLGVHESQSRLWENLVGRSREFWAYYYPKLQDVFPSQLDNVSLDDFYKGINKVEPSLIRVEADEATYNLHIMLRLELEIAMLEGSVKTKELPEIWNSKMEEYLGITPMDDAKGVLQDVHWSFGLYGYFSTYALGNLISVQLWNRMLEDLPDVKDQMRGGNFEPVLTWMKEKVHRHGAKFEPQELVERVTGSRIDGEPYLNYLKTKFGEIYNL